jgi:hypothetical protein
VPYEPGVRILGAALIFLATILVASVPDADAQRRRELPRGPTAKTQSVCNQRILPLVEGNKWTYGFVQSAAVPPPELTKLIPSQPGQIVITVKSIETRGADTVVTLEEKSTADISRDPKKHIIDERTLTTTITCNRTKFEISPESFFFSGEPGGHFGLTFDKVDRLKDTTWKLSNGAIGEGEWREDLVMRFSRQAFEGSGAKLDSGKIELERKFIPAQPENINTKVGVYTAEKLAITTTGRVTLDHPQPDSKPMELPAGWINFLWIAPNVGVIQVLNAYAHQYQLVEVALK